MARHHLDYVALLHRERKYLRLTGPAETGLVRHLESNARLLTHYPCDNLRVEFGFSLEADGH